jgi:flagellar assembly protein FliH
MSTAMIIPKERLTDCQPWKPVSFHSAAPASQAAPVPTVQHIECIEQQAREEGYAAGYAEGRLAAESEAQRLRSLAESLEAAWQQFDQSIGQDLLDLALEVAKQVLCGVLRVRAEAVLPVVQEAIRALPHCSQPVQIVLNPADAELVRAHLGEGFARSGWKIVEDPGMQKGGCRVESVHTRIDATLPTRWQRVVSVLGQDSRWLE